MITFLRQPPFWSRIHRLSPTSRGRSARSWGQLAGLSWLVLLLSPVAAQVAGSITVYPANSTLESTGTRQFTAYVPISPNTIQWLVNDIPGGNASVGTISATGLYQPPTVIPAVNVVAIKARSVPYPSSSGSAKLTITRQYPWLWSVNPAKLSVGSYEVSFNGANFAPDSVAQANGVDLPTTYFSSTKITVKGQALSAGTLSFAVRQPGPGAVTGNSVSAAVTVPAVTVRITPSSASMALGESRTFSASVAGAANTSVKWSVNGIIGGSSIVGLISSGGVYRAPAVMPTSSTVTLRATSVADNTAFAQAKVTLVAPPPPAVTVQVSPPAASLLLGSSQAFVASVAGTANTTVTWAVNGVVGGSAAAGTISAAGMYVAPAAMPAGGTVTVRATSVADGTAFAQAVVTLSAPPPVSTWLAGARFLEQTSFGPTPATLARVQQLGMAAYLDEQFAWPETSIPTPAGNSMGTLRQWMLANYGAAPDQLRQRVAYALSQVVVTSGAKLVYADEMLPWLRLLSQHAFGNYRDLLRDVTRSPSMGKYLDLANSVKPGGAGGANENYARELMQLFTIGLWELNQDGSQKLDAGGQPIPTYNQQTVQQVALALTGWTDATAPGAAPQVNNWEYFGAPMESRQQSHATGAKSFLGSAVPAGQTVEQDLESLLDVLMNHPNIAPFIATRLIRSLVMSNPSPGYIQRVANVFVNNGSGVRGDLRAVVRAIILDSEARQDTPGVQAGRLKEPILQVTGFLRALNGHFNSDQQLTYLFDYMAQPVLEPPSVFSWFSPLFHLPKSSLFGPEFQIYSPTEATLRGNLFHYLLSQPGSDFVLDLSPFQAYGSDLASLVEVVNQTLLYGRMPAGMKQVLIDAAAPGYDARTRIETVLYLTALSGQYAVQY